jgi:hypothetical protein
MKGRGRDIGRAFQGRFLMVAGATVAAFLLATGASAQAAEAPLVPPGFKLTATNGYTLSVFGLRDPDTGAGAIFVTMRSRRAEALYSAPASIGPTSIEADLGAIGRIDVDFASSGQSRSERSVCGGKSVLVDPGRYEGIIDFEGEERYSQVHASSARGEATMALSLGCPGGPKSEGIGGNSPGARLTVKHHGSPRFEFSAMKNSPSRPARFTVSIEEHRGYLRISRRVRVTTGSDAYDFNVPSGTAHVDPPAPFAGEASYRRPSDKSARWRGDLSVDFPGHAGVRLTGADTRASLVRAVLNPSHPFLADGCVSLMPKPANARSC